jgi:hypothetical protein
MWLWRKQETSAQFSFCQKPSLLLTDLSEDWDLYHRIIFKCNFKKMWMWTGFSYLRIRSHGKLWWWWWWSFRLCRAMTLYLWFLCPTSHIVKSYSPNTVKTKLLFFFKCIFIIMCLFTFLIINWSSYFWDLMSHVPNHQLPPEGHISPAEKQL